ncbi:MAG: acyl-CoA dehydrogenase family protein [Terriglobales bacterium]
MPTYQNIARPEEWITDTDRQFADAIRKWVDNDVWPNRRKIDDDWAEHKIVKPIMKKLMVDIGYQRGVWPEEVGGLGASSAVGFVVCSEEIARGDSGMCTAANCCGWPFLHITLPSHRNERLIQKFGPMFCNTDKMVMGCPAITDARSGSDVENIDATHGKYVEVRADDGGDHWTINGHKLWCTNSGGLADIFGVFCTTNPGVEDDESFALIYVPADTPGVTQGKPYKKAGMSADLNSDIWFENVKVPKENRAAGRGLDAQYAREMISWGNVITGGYALGSMNRVYEILMDWVNNRVVAGKILKEHSVIAAHLGEIMTLIEMVKSDTYCKARMLDRADLYGPGWTKEMLAKTRSTKLFSTDALTKICNTAIDLMGAAGYAHEFDMEKIWRDSKIMSLWMGGRTLARLDTARYYFDCKEI